MFRIELDADAKLVRITVAGFWEPQDVPVFAKAVGARAQEARAAGDDFNVLIESLDFPVQSNEVADLLASVMAGGAALTSGWIAVVVGSQLNKLQAERTLLHPRLRVFLSIAEARDWLDTR